MANLVITFFYMSDCLWSIYLSPAGKSFCPVTLAFPPQVRGEEPGWSTPPLYPGALAFHPQRQRQMGDQQVGPPVAMPNEHTCDKTKDNIIMKLSSISDVLDSLTRHFKIWIISFRSTELVSQVFTIPGTEARGELQIRQFFKGVMNWENKIYI